MRTARRLLIFSVRVTKHKPYRNNLNVVFPIGYGHNIGNIKYQYLGSTYTRKS